MDRSARQARDTATDHGRRAHRRPRDKVRTPWILIVIWFGGIILLSSDPPSWAGWVWLVLWVGLSMAWDSVGDPMSAWRRRSRGRNRARAERRPTSRPPHKSGSDSPPPRPRLRPGPRGSG
jgi:hypothetical protein